jgi:hypothetical protein
MDAHGGGVPVQTETRNHQRDAGASDVTRERLTGAKPKPMCRNACWVLRLNPKLQPQLGHSTASSPGRRTANSPGRLVDWSAAGQPGRVAAANKELDDQRWQLPLS